MAQYSGKSVIYARVSSKEQEDTGYSLPAQEQLLKRYATEKGLEVVKVFSVAESASGAKERRVFGEMIEYATKQGVQHILCEKADRLSRNMKEAVSAYNWIDDDEKRFIHFVKQGLVMHKNAKSEEKFRWDMEIVLAKRHIANLSEEVKKGQAEKIRQGWLPTKPPLGYETIGGKGHKTHIPDPDTAPLVKRAFELYAAGAHSLVALGDVLYSDGLRTRGGYKLSKARLHEILGDPFYYGAMRWKDVVYRAQHEALVSKETFDAVQAVMHGRTTPHHKRRHFTFTKMLKCGECGGTVSGEIHKGHTYYYCKHQKTCPQRGGTREEDLEKQLIGVFQFFEGLNSSEADEIYKKIREDHREEAEFKINALDALHRRDADLQRRVDILYDDRLASRISQERWETKQSEINAERAVIKGDIERMQREETKYFELYINIIDLARRAAQIYAKRTPEQRRALLAQIFSNLTLKDKKVAYLLRPPIAKLAARVQQQLDAQKNLEPTKKGSTKSSDAPVDPYIRALLPG